MKEKQTIRGTNGEVTMEANKEQLFRVLCVEDDGDFDYKNLENANFNSIEGILEFMKSKFNVHKGAKWVVLPYDEN